MGWSIDNGASITQDGYVTIPSTSSAKSYKVTYTNGSCTCYHTINQSAPGPGPEPTECTNWSSWSSWSVDDLSCRGGDSSATASRTRYCLTNPSDIDTEYKTVNFSTTSCNSGNRQLVYNSGGITVYQAGGCSCGSPSTCDSETHKTSGCISKDGGSGILIGTYDSMAGCSGTWTVTEKPSWLSNISFSNGNITATVEPNTGDERTERVKTYLSDIGSDYFDVTQCKGSSPGEDCTCSKAHFSVTGKTIEAGSNVTIAEYTADCDDGAEVRNEGGDDFLNVSNATFSNGKIKISSVSEVSSNKSGNYAVYIDGTRCDGFTVKQNKPSGGNIDKTITLTIQTTQSKIYMSSIDATISLQPKTSGVGSSVTLGGTGWLNEQNCTDWTNNWSQSIHLSGSYTGSISDYNFQVSFQRRVLKKQKTTTTCDTLSDVTATGTMNGVGPSSASMSSGGVFSVGLTSESNIGSSISVLLTTR